MVNLVCEGNCNPNLRMLDYDLKTAERADAGIYTDKLTKKATILFVSLLSPGVVARVRALKHTEHREKTGGMYECADCGTARRF